MTIRSLVGMFQPSTPSQGGAPNLPVSYEAENFVSTATERNNYEKNYSKERTIRFLSIIYFLCRNYQVTSRILRWSRRSSGVGARSERT